MPDVPDLTTDLVERIELFLERVDLDVSVPMALTDIAPVEQWEAVVLHATDDRAAEAFLRTTTAILGRRYPFAVPFPFDRLPAVAIHEGWWAEVDDGRAIALQVFDAYVHGGSDEAAVLYALTGNRPAALRGLLEIAGATLCAAQSHPEASSD